MLCSCDRTEDKENVTYICEEDTCPNHNVTLLYCQLCCEEGKHSHKPVRIMPKMEAVRKDWEKLLTTSSLINNAVCA